MLIPMLNLVVGQDIYDTELSIADLGETDKSWELEYLWEKPKTGRELEKSKVYFNQL